MASIYQHKIAPFGNIKLGPVSIDVAKELNKIFKVCKEEIEELENNEVTQLRGFKIQKSLLKQNGIKF